jgi:hypothetical protein
MRSKAILLIVLAALCCGCSVTRNYLQKTVTLVREGFLWEWVVRPDGMQCESLYLDGRVTNYVKPLSFTSAEYLAPADYEINQHKFYRVDRYPDRAYRIRQVDAKMIAPDGTINASRPQPFISRKASYGPLRVLRLPAGTQVFVKSINVRRIPDPDGYYLYWNAWEDLTLELTLPGEDKKVTVNAIPSDFLKLVE